MPRVLGVNQGEQAMSDKIKEVNCSVILWDCSDDAEVLYHKTQNEAIETFLDDLAPDEREETVTVYGYARMVVPKPGLSDAKDLVDETFEGRWEEFIGEDGPDITDRMNEAALTFLTVLHEEFTPWACEQITSEEVNVAAWVAENRPDWLKENRP